MVFGRQGRSLRAGSPLIPGAHVLNEGHLTRGSKAWELVAHSYLQRGSHQRLGSWHKRCLIHIPHMGQIPLVWGVLDGSVGVPTLLNVAPSLNGGGAGTQRKGRSSRAGSPLSSTFNGEWLILLGTKIKRSFRLNINPKTVLICRQDRRVP